MSATDEIRTLLSDHKGRTVGEIMDTLYPDIPYHECVAKRTRVYHSLYILLKFGIVIKDTSVSPIRWRIPVE